MSNNQEEEKASELYVPIKCALDGIEDGVIVVSADRLVEYLNSAAEKLFGIMLNRNVQPTFIEVVRDYECESLLRMCIETCRHQSASIRLREGRKLLQVSVVPDSRQQHFIVIMKDLTEHQHLEEIRRDLISNISHEFRTPIASIKLLAETLVDGAVNDPEKSKEFLMKISVEADKLVNITEDLRELAAIEKGGSILRKGAVDIGQLIRHVVLRLETQARAGGLKVEVQIEQELPSPVIDGSRIESVLMNLVHNAIKFTYPGGKISIMAKREQGNILISVGDTGQGISAEDLPRVFERFYKVDKARVGEGSGLGLSISKHIIMAHGGKIWVESEPGVGSTFYFTLPLTA